MPLDDPSRDVAKGIQKAANLTLLNFDASTVEPILQLLSLRRPGGSLVPRQIVSNVTNTPQRSFPLNVPFFPIVKDK